MTSFLHTSITFSLLTACQLSGIVARVFFQRCCIFSHNVWEPSEAPDSSMGECLGVGTRGWGYVGGEGVDQEES